MMSRSLQANTPSPTATYTCQTNSTLSVKDSAVGTRTGPEDAAVPEASGSPGCPSRPCPTCWWDLQRAQINTAVSSVFRGHAEILIDPKSAEHLLGSEKTCMWEEHKHTGVNNRKCSRMQHVLLKRCSKVGTSFSLRCTLHQQV